MPGGWSDVAKKLAEHARVGEEAVRYGRPYHRAATPPDGGRVSHHRAATPPDVPLPEHTSKVVKQPYFGESPNAEIEAPIVIESSETNIEDEYEDEYEEEDEDDIPTIGRLTERGDAVIEPLPPPGQYLGEYDLGGFSYNIEDIDPTRLRWLDTHDIVVIDKKGRIEHTYKKTMRADSEGPGAARKVIRTTQGPNDIFNNLTSRMPYPPCDKMRIYTDGPCDKIFLKSATYFGYILSTVPIDKGTEEVSIYTKDSTFFIRPAWELYEEFKASGQSLVTGADQIATIPNTSRLNDPVGMQYPSHCFMCGYREKVAEAMKHMDELDHDSVFDADHHYAALFRAWSNPSMDVQQKITWHSDSRSRNIMDKKTGCRPYVIIIETSKHREESVALRDQYWFDVWRNHPLRKEMMVDRRQEGWSGRMITLFLFLLLVIILLVSFWILMVRRGGRTHVDGVNLGAFEFAIIIAFIILFVLTGWNDWNKTC